MNKDNSPKKENSTNNASEDERIDLEGKLWEEEERKVYFEEGIDDSTEDNKEMSKAKVKAEKGSLKSRNFQAVLIDTVVELLLSVILMGILSGALLLFGYIIKLSYIPVFLLIAYGIVSILYPVIMQNSKGNTIGRTLSGISIIREDK